MLSCVGLIPAEETVKPAAGLNVLVMAINRGSEAVTRQIALFGALEGSPRLLTAKPCTLTPGEHAHLYFHIPAQCFTAAFWDGEAPEEMTLFAGTDSPQTRGELVFVEA